MNYKIVAAVSIAAALIASPAAAKSKMMSCSTANMNKMYMSMGGMPDSPKKWHMAKHMGMMNADLSKGNMRGACKHMMMAQSGKN